MSASANGFAGAAGCAVNGTTVFDELDGSDVPTALVAVTLKLYETLFVRPETSHVSAGASTVQVKFPGVEVTVYDVIALWFSAGLTHVTVAISEPATATGAAG